MCSPCHAWRKRHFECFSGQQLPIIISETKTSQMYQTTRLGTDLNYNTIQHQSAICACYVSFNFGCHMEQLVALELFSYDCVRQGFLGTFVNRRDCCGPHKHSAQPSTHAATSWLQVLLSSLISAREKTAPNLFDFIKFFTITIILFAVNRLFKQSITILYNN